MNGIDGEIVDVGFAKLDPDTGELLVNADAMLGATYEETPVLSQLGVTAMPYPATDGGTSQMLVLTGIAGANGVCVGGNDTRTAKITGNMKPGDTIVHSTGPQQAAQLQLKEEKRQCALVTKNKAKKDFGLFIDGKAESVTLTLPQGGTLQLSVEHHGMTLSSPNGMTQSPRWRVTIALKSLHFNPQDHTVLRATRWGGSSHMKPRANYGTQGTTWTFWRYLTRNR